VVWTYAEKCIEAPLIRVDQMEDRLLVRDREDQEKTINKTNEKDF